MSDTPVILLGLDAADIVLIERWAAEGRLPAFASLFATAAHGRLDTPAAVLQASIWPSFATATHPGKHGSYFKLQMRPGTNALMRIRATDVRRDPFWTRLEGPAETAVVIDVPKMPPSPGLNGAQVIEWGTTDHYASFGTVPRDLANPLLREFGAHPLFRDLTPPASVTACLRLKTRLLRGIDMKQRLNLASLTRHRPRVFVSVFGESHPAGHYFWRFTDERHPDYIADENAGRALLEVYAALDKAVGDIVERYSGSANCIIFSGHGMTTDYHPHAMVGELLCRMGLTVRGQPGPRARPVRALGQSALLAGITVVPESIRRLASRHVTRQMREYVELLKGLSGVDFSRTQAFALPTDLQGFIRVNLRGREPEGIVPPERYDALCDTIVEELHSLRDAATGEPVVEKVYRTRALFGDGENVDCLPDLCVRWTNTAPVTRVLSPRHGTFDVVRTFPERSGNHRLEGFWFAVGPDIDTTRRHHRAQVYDLAATVFHLLGKPIPDEWDGRPLPAVLPGAEAHARA